MSYIGTLSGMVSYGSTFFFGNNGNNNNNTQNSEKKESGHESEDFSLFHQLITDIESLTEKNKELTTRIAQLEGSPEKKTDAQPKDKDQDPNKDDFSKISLIPHSNVRFNAAQIVSKFPDEILYSTGTRQKKDQTIDLTFESTLQELQHEKEELEIQKTNLQAQLKEAQEALEKAKLEKDQQQERLTTYGKALEENKTRTEETERARHKAEAELETERLHNQKLQERLTAYEKALEENKTRTEETEKARQKAEAELETERLQRQELETRLGKQESQIENLNTEVSTLNEKVKEHKDLTLMANTKLNEVEQEFIKVKKEKLESESQLAAQKKLVEESNTEKLILEGNKEALQEMLDEKTEKLENKTLVHNNLKAEYSAALSDGGKIHEKWTEIDKNLTEIQEYQTKEKGIQKQLTSLRNDRLGMAGGLLLLGGITGMIIGTVFCPALLPVTIAAIKISLPFLVASGALILAGIATSAKALYNRTSATFFNNENPVQNTTLAAAPR